MDHDETCDVIFHDPAKGEIGKCHATAVARTKAIISPVTRTGFVRYCSACHENVKSWGILTEPWPIPAGV